MGAKKYLPKTQYRIASHMHNHQTRRVPIIPESTSNLVPSVPCGLTYDLSDTSQHARHAHEALALRQRQCVAHTGAVDATKERQLKAWQQVKTGQSRSHKKPSTEYRTVEHAFMYAG